MKAVIKSSSYSRDVRRTAFLRLHKQMPEGYEENPPPRYIIFDVFYDIVNKCDKYSNNE